MGQKYAVVFPLDQNSCLKVYWVAVVGQMALIEGNLNLKLLLDVPQIGVELAQEFLEKDRGDFEGFALANGVLFN